MLCLITGIWVVSEAYAENIMSESEDVLGGFSEGEELFDLSGIDGAANGDESELALELDNSSVSEKTAQSGWWRKFAGDDANFVYIHELSYIVTEPSRVETNRSSLRLKWNRFFGSSVYFGFDGKSILYFENDNQTPEYKTVDYGSNIKEFFLQASWGNNSLSLGKQLVIWGETETATVTDVFSPRNLTDFIFTSLDESRIGQWMIKYERHSDFGHWTLLINPDVEVNQQPDALELESSELISNDLADDIDHQEYGFRWKKPIGNGDYSLMLAKLVDNQGVFFYRGQQGNMILVDKQYRQYDMIGMAANLNFGRYGLELETAYNSKFPLQTRQPYSVSNPGVAERNQLLTGSTLKFNQDGLREWVFGVANKHIYGEVDSLDVIDEDTWNFMFRWSEKYLYETLILSYQYQYQLKTNSKVHKLTTRYAFTDNLYGNFDAFVLDGLGADTIFEQDSVYLRVEYHF